MEQTVSEHVEKAHSCVLLAHGLGFASLLRRNSCKASAFARYFVGNRVCSLVDGLSHLHTNLLPNADVLPSYYSNVVSTLRTVSVKSDCTVKSVYSLLVQPLLVPPRCEVFWNGC